MNNEAYNKHYETSHKYGAIRFTFYSYKNERNDNINIQQI